MSTSERLTTQQIDAFIRKLCVSMGPDWSYKSGRIGETESNFRQGTLVRSDYTAEIGFGTQWPNHDKLHVYGIYPRDSRGKDHSGYYQAPDPSINVSLSRSPDSVAADIHKRFIPVYMERLSKALTSINEAEAYLDHKSDIGQDLHVAFPQMRLIDNARCTEDGRYSGDDKVTLDYKRINIDVSRGYQSPDECVKITLDGLTPDQAKAILTAAMAVIATTEEDSDNA